MRWGKEERRGREERWKREWGRRGEVGEGVEESRSRKRGRGEEETVISGEKEGHGLGHGRIDERTEEIYVLGSTREKKKEEKENEEEKEERC